MCLSAWVTEEEHPACRKCSPDGGGGLQEARVLSKAGLAGVRCPAMKLCVAAAGYHENSQLGLQTARRSRPGTHGDSVAAVSEQGCSGSPSRPAPQLHAAGYSPLSLGEGPENDFNFSI